MRARLTSESNPKSLVQRYRVALLFLDLHYSFSLLEFSKVVARVMTHQTLIAKELNRCIEMLYDDADSAKLEATRNILGLCQSPEGRQVLAESETALGILSRTLREESKTLSEISLSILCCFLFLASSFTFHGVLKANQCGDVTFRVLEYEIQKRASVLADLNTESGTRTKLNQQSWLIHVCVSILRLLAEDLLVEKKMMNRKLGTLLISLLSRDHEPLLLNVLEFMKKLSVVGDYKDQLLSEDVIPNITHLTLTHKNLEISKLSLHVLFNLSFDDTARIQISKEGTIAQIIDFLQIPGLRADSLRILALLACDAQLAPVIATEDSVDLLMQLAIGYPGETLGTDLASVLSSIAWTNPALVANNPLILDFFGRAVKGRDAGAFCALKNIALDETSCKTLTTLLNKKFPGWEGEVMSLGKTGSDALLAEIIGFIASLPKRINSTLQQILTSGLKSKNADACLHAVLASRGVTGVIPDLVNVAAETNDLVTLQQALFSLRQMPVNSRPSIIKTANIEKALTRAISSDCKEVSSEAELLGGALNFGEVFPGWREELKRKRFLAANPNWSKFCAGSVETENSVTTQENWIFFENSTLAN